VQQFPTPQILQEAGRKKWEKFLHTHKLWRPQTRDQRLGVFAAANTLRARAPITRAKSLLAVSLVKLLLTLKAQLEAYRQQINEAFRSHPDHDLFGGLPGAKAVLSPRLLAELGSVREEYPDAESLMCQAGVSPVSYQSGQIDKCRLRRACNKVLRQTVHLWVNASRATCAWAKDYYQLKRRDGHSHASALRCLGKRWLKILWRFWQSRTQYDEATHLKNQQRAGQVIWKQLQAAAAPTTQ